MHYTSVAVKERYVRGDYNWAPFAPATLHALLKRAQKSLDNAPKFHGFVGTGLSGVSFMAPLAAVTNRPFGVLRKEETGESRTHSYRRTEGYWGPTAIFVDDFVGSGATLKRVVEAAADNGTKIVGALLYQANFNTGGIAAVNISRMGIGWWDGLMHENYHSEFVEYADKTEWNRLQKLPPL